MDLHHAKFHGTIHQLPQGLTLVHHHIPGAGVVVGQVWVSVGTNAQEHYHGGLAHFIEHLIFKGSEKILPGQFDRLIEGLGGKTSAATGYDYTHFSLVLSPEHFEIGFAAFGDILTTPAFPRWEMEQERAVVLEEIYTCESDPDWIVGQSLARSLFLHHDYGKPLLGDPDSVKDLDTPVIQEFHHSHYQPENFTIVVVGEIKLPSAIALIHKYFNNYYPARSYPYCDITPYEHLQGYDRQELTYPHLQECRLAMAWHCPGISKFWEICGLDLLSMVLTGHSSGLLITALQEPHLVWDVASSMTVKKFASMFTIKIWLESHRFKQVESLICQCLEYLVCHPISKRTLNKAQKILINEYIFATETPFQLAELYGSYGAMADVSLAGNYPHIIHSYTPAQLQYIAQLYLSPNRYALSTMQAKEK